MINNPSQDRPLYVHEIAKPHPGFAGQAGCLAPVPPGIRADLDHLNTRLLIARESLEKLHARLEPVCVGKPQPGVLTAQQGQPRSSIASTIAQIEAIAESIVNKIDVIFGEIDL